MSPKGELGEGHIVFGMDPIGLSIGINILVSSVT